MKKRLQVNEFVLVIMRVSILQIFLLSGFISISYANDGIAQEILDKKFSIDLEKTNLRTVLAKIEKETGATFIYYSQLIPREKLTLHLSNETLGQVLNEILLPRGIVFEADGTHIILSREKANVSFYDSSEQSKSAQTLVSVTGKITDESDGSPLPGVNIIVKGTTNGTTTDNEGNYVLNITDGNAVLVFSFIGYTSQEVPVGEQTVINVRLAPDIRTLEEVVVVGYGEQKKTSLTAAVGTLKGQNVAQSPVVNLTNNLAGRISGVIISQANGEPGFDGSKISIRGVATNGNSNPLLVVDGIYRDFSKLDPTTIDTYTVLKDAAAVAPYGLAGANGVILVTTKKGKAGAPSLTYNTYVGFQNPTRATPFVNSVEYARMRNEAAKNENQAPPFTDAQIAEYQKTVNGDPDADPDLYPNSNGVKDILEKNAKINYHNLELSGGSDNIRYYTALAYTSQEGQWTTTKYKKYNMVLGIDADATSTTLISLKLNGTVENGLYPGTSATGLMYQAVRNPPIAVNYYSNGLWGQYTGRSLVGQAYHSGYESTETTNVMTNLSIEQKLPFLQGLSIKGVVSYDPTYKFEKKWHTPVPVYTLNTSGDTRTFDLGYQGPAKPNLEQRYNHNKAFTYQGYLNYQRSFGQHDVSFLGVIEARNQKYNDMTSLIINYNSSIDELSTGSATPTDYTVTGTSSAQEQIGYIYRVSYAYANKYMVEVAGRYDGHFAFAPGRRYDFFPSYSVGWNLSEEGFIKNNFPQVDFLKIRASYGKSGNLPYDGTNLATFQYVSSNVLYAGAYNFGNTPGQGLKETLEANPFITWERSTKYNLGLEASLWNGKLTLEGELFSENRTAMLMEQDAKSPLEYGVKLGRANVGEMDNRGFEISLGTSHTFENGIRFNVNGNLTYAKNKMIQILEPVATYDNPNRRRTGRPLNTQFGFETLGYFSADDFNPDGSLKEGIPTQPWGAVQPGDLRYADISGPNGTPDGVITVDDETVIGRPKSPQIMFGFMPNIAYKGFDLDLLFQGAASNDLYLSGNMAHPFDGSSSATILQYEDHWTPANTDALYPRLATAPTSNNTQGSSWWIRDGRYVRLKNLQLGYTFPQSLSQHLKIVKSLRLYVAGQNLFTWTPKMDEKIDPEATSGDNINGQYYFQQKVISIGTSIKF